MLEDIQQIFKIFFRAMTIIMAALSVCAVLGAIGFTIYLLITIIGPWILSALLTTGLPSVLGLMVVSLPALIIAAPIFFVLCLALSQIIKKLKGDYDADHHLRAYFERRRNNNDGKYYALFLINSCSAIPIGIAVGIYLAVSILPSFISALVASGISSLLAISAGVVLGGTFVILVCLFFMLPTWIYWRVMLLPGAEDIRDNPLQILSLLAMFFGVGLGCYIASLVFPLLMSTLAALALPHATMVLAGIIICSELVLALSFCSFMATGSIAALFNAVDFRAIQIGLGNKYNQIRRKFSRIRLFRSRENQRNIRLEHDNPIQQALAEYHQNKSLGWKLLYFITRGYYGANSAIRKIEALLKKNGDNKQALKTLLGQRIKHTAKTPYFYTKSPLNPVNQAYMAIAKILAGQNPRKEPLLFCD